MEDGGTASLQRTAEQSVDTPGAGRRPGGGGDLQGLRPGQDSTAFGGAEHVDIPVPRGRGGWVGRGGLLGFSQEHKCEKPHPQKKVCGWVRTRGLDWVRTLFHGRRRLVVASDSFWSWFSAFAGLHEYPGAPHGSASTGVCPW